MLLRIAAIMLLIVGGATFFAGAFGSQSALTIIGVVLFMGGTLAASGDGAGGYF